MSPKISIDTSLVVPWSLELIQDEPFEYPFKADYQLSTKRLIYIAALHSYKTDSKTFKIIEDSIKSEKIDLIILEGIKFSLGISPENLKAWALKQELDKLYDGFETTYAISLAIKHKIPFIDCEPDDSVIYNEALKRGYSAEDLLFYYFVQQIFQTNSTESNVNSQLRFEQLVNLKGSPLKLLTLPTYSDFQSWYLKNNGQKFDPSLIDEEVPAPYENGKLFTQRISSLVCKTRDQFILTKIESFLNIHNSVLYSP